MAAAAAAALSNLVPKLHDLITEEYNLQRSVKGRIFFLLHELLSMRDAVEFLSREQADEQFKLWAEDLMDLVYSLEGLVDMGTDQLRTAVPPGGSKGFVAKISISSKLKTEKARRQFASKIEFVGNLLHEISKRRERYRVELDSTRLPSRHPRLDDPPDGSETMEITTVAADLATLLADAGDVYKFPSGVKGAIRFLQRELQNMQVALRMVAKVPADELDEGTKAWAEDLRDVSCDIKHAVDNAPRLKRTGFAGIISFNSMKSRRKFAADVRDLKQRVFEVAERRRRYHLGGIGVPRRVSFSEDSPSDSVGPQLPDRLQDLGSLVAIDGPRDVLVKLLTDEGSTLNQQLKLASIVGLACVGKTMLAKAVHNSIAPQFDITAWVSLSYNPDMKKVFKDLLRRIRQEQYRDVPLNVLDERQLIDEIRETLQDKRYFVVVDDIWHSSAWNLVRYAFVENNKGSAVLTTSRKVDVAEHVGRVYRLHPLSDSDSTKLFYQRLFGSEDNCPSELADISRKFIAKCHGIPLTIVATADLLRTKSLTVEAWHAVFDSAADNGLQRGPYDLRSIFALSYTDLPFHLKLCLLYLSMFQKGYQISGESLVWGWIAEGFIQGTAETQERTLLEVGEGYLNELINRNLIEPVEVDADVKACRVYDSVHDLIISLSTEENFATILDGLRGRSLPGTVHRLSIQGNSVEHPLPQVPLSRVRSLVVSGDAKLVPSLSDFQELRVLDLGGCDSLQNDHLKGIEKLVLLKYLVIGGNCISGIPKEIESIVSLQTLDLRASGLTELPESVVKFRNLKRLCVNSRMKIPDGIGEMEALQELGDINISKPELLKQLCNLANLRVLKIAIWSWDESYNEALLEYLRSLFSGSKQQIQTLSILTCCSLHFMDRLDAEWAPASLQKLEIRYSAFLALPSWIGSLQNISSLSMAVYKLSQGIINVLGMLPSLCYLSLTSKHAPDGRFGIGTDRFRNLTNFHFVSNAMKNIFGPQPEAMQMLKRLKLSFHASQTKDVNQGFNFGLECLCSLEHVLVEIVCFDASQQVVKSAEDAISEAISRGRIPRPNYEIRRVRERDMVESEVGAVVPNIKLEQQKGTKNMKSSSRKIRVTAKKFRQKEKGVVKKYKIVSLHLKRHILTLQAL